MCAVVSALYACGVMLDRFGPVREGEYVTYRTWGAGTVLVESVSDKNKDGESDSWIAVLRLGKRGQLKYVLDDRDWNGIPDRWTVLTDGNLPFVHMLEDDDGDGKPDRQEVEVPDVLHDRWVSYQDLNLDGEFEKTGYVTDRTRRWAPSLQPEETPVRKLNAPLEEPDAGRVTDVISSLGE